MANLSAIEKLKLEKMFDMSDGYVSDFSNNSFREFIFSVVKKDIYDSKYQLSGESKAKRFKAFWDIEPDIIVGKVIEQLLHFLQAKGQINSTHQTTASHALCEEAMKIAQRLQNINSAGDAPNEDLFLQKELDEIIIAELGLDKDVTLVLQSRMTELKNCLKANASLSSIFLCGSILEGVLLGLAKRHMKEFNQATCCPKSKDTGITKPFHEWTLSNFIDIAHEIQFLGLDVKKYSHVLRDFRNFIHPNEQVRLKFNPDIHTAKISWQVTKAALHDIHKKLSSSG